MLGTIKLERDGLINGHSNGFCRGVAIVSDMNGNGFSLQASTSFSITNMPRYSFPQLLPFSLLPPAMAKWRIIETVAMKESSPAVRSFRVPGSITGARVVLHEPSVGSGTNLNSSSLLIPDSHDGRRSAKRAALRE